MITLHYIILRVDVERLGPDSSFVPRNRARIKEHKLKHRNFPWISGKRFFTLRVTDYWNRLSREVVESSSLETFKTCLVQSCATCSRWTCFSRGIGLQDLPSRGSIILACSKMPMAIVFYSSSPGNLIDFSYSHTFDSVVTSALPWILSSTKVCSCWESATPARHSGLLVWLPGAAPCSALLYVPKVSLPSLDFLLPRDLHHHFCFQSECSLR